MYPRNVNARLEPPHYVMIRAGSRPDTKLHMYTAAQQRSLPYTYT